MSDIGRNDYCFCGSNKKYKNCCMNRKYYPGLGLDKLNLNEKDTFRVKAAYATFYAIGKELKDCLSMTVDLEIKDINRVNYFITIISNPTTNFELLGLQNKGKVMCLKPLNCNSKELSKYVSILDNGKLLIENSDLDFLDMMTILPEDFMKKEGTIRYEQKGIRYQTY
jgi:hypothetical protein